MTSLYRRNTAYIMYYVNYNSRASYVSNYFCRCFMPGRTVVWCWAWLRADCTNLTYL